MPLALAVAAALTIFTDSIAEPSKPARVEATTGSGLSDAALPSNSMLTVARPSLSTCPRNSPSLRPSAIYGRRIALPR